MKYCLNDENSHSSVSISSYYLGQTLEINQALSFGDETIKEYALKIKKAGLFSYKNCDKNEKEYDIFNDLEKRAIEIEEEELKKHKWFMKKVEASVCNIETISNRDDYQVWNLKRDSLVFPEHLIDNVKANKFYKTIKNLSNVFEFFIIGTRF